MNRRRFLGGMAAISLVDSASAQPRIRRVAVVSVGDVARQPLASLIHGLRELGYQTERDLEIIPATHPSYARLGEKAAEAVKREPEVIVCNGGSATRAAKAATWSIPIVMVVGLDPVEHGFVRTYARPEGNITGIMHSSRILSAKRVELLKELMPGMRRLGVLWSGESATQAGAMKDVENAAKRLGLSAHPVEVSSAAALKAAFTAFSDARVEAIFVVASVLMMREAAEVVRLAGIHKLPTAHSDANAVRLGGLLSYGPDYPAQFRQAAVYVDKILKGAKPAEMPVEQATKFELIVNLKTAKAHGVEIPKSVLIRADEVIQ
jgi:putative ABC transport system substrate-binding protein